MRFSTALSKGPQQHAASQIMSSDRDCFYPGAMPRLHRTRARTDFRWPGFLGRARTSRLECGRARLGFATVSHPAARNECGATQPPQALATPDPLLEEAELNEKVSVSFVIGTDGRVHSALILESAGPSEDRTILDAVRFWRYRPALCNGVPTEAEAKVEFSSR
jgi:TonB family protein